MSIESIVYSVVGVVFGLILGWVFYTPRIKSASEKAQADAQAEKAVLQEKLVVIPKLEKELEAAKERVQDLSGQMAEVKQAQGEVEATLRAREEQIGRDEGAIERLQGVRDELESQLSSMKAEMASISSELDAEREKGAEKLELLEQAREQLSLQFKELANQILEEKSKRFTEQNQTNIKQILDPLGVKLADFKAQVEKSYDQENKDRAALSAQVKQLMDLNVQLSDDAKNLTSALKGQSKVRGDWGELMLERVLEGTGLRKGHEYTVQESHTRDDGTRVQPDVVVHLPGDKHLVVDSKVSLTAYLEYAEAESDEKRDAALKRHLVSVKTHIKDLSSKNYQTLYGLQSLDCVIMFVPIEPAFMLAISGDSNLWQDAWAKNVILVSPTTLLFVIRTVAQVWRQERQNLNAQEIAQRGAALYDKFSNFVSDLEMIGKRIQMARDSYDKAHNKLRSGAGNLVRQAEMLKELGVSPKKTLPTEMVESAFDSSKGLPQADSPGEPDNNEDSV